MGNLFSFSIGNKKDLIMFFINPFLFLMNLHINHIFIEFQETIQTFSENLGYIIINGILYLIYCLKQKNSDKQKETPKMNHKIIILIIIMIILDLIRSFQLIFFSKFKKFDFHSSTYCLEILSLWIFSKLIFKLKLEKHHILSIIMITIGLLYLFHFSEKKLKFTYINDWILFLGTISIHLTNPLNYVISFQIFYSELFNFNFILLILGCFELLFLIILSFINYFFHIKYIIVDVYNEIINLKNFNILNLLIVSLSNGITYNFIWLFFKTFKPWFFGITLAINALIYQFRIFSQKKNFKIYCFFDILVFVILIFFCLVFNEQIICNFCGMNDNTKNEISERGNKEINDILIEELDDESSNSFA